MTQTNLAEVFEGMSLADELKRTRDVEGVTFAELANRTGISRSAISQAANQGLHLKPEQEAKLWGVIQEIKGTDAQLGTDQPAAPVKFNRTVELYETKEYKEAMGWCAYVFKKRKMGVLIGYPGSGKTTVLRNFCNVQPGVLYVEAWPQMRMGDMLETIARGLGISIKGNSYSKTQALIDALRGREDVMIAVDEAEYLAKWDVDKLEVLRKIWDNTGTPIILCGTEQLEVMLTRGPKRENLAQLYRRKVEIKLKGISPAEARNMLRGYNIAQDAADDLAAIAGDVKHGGMGTFAEILDLCLEAAEGGEITRAILASARKYKLMY